MAQEYNQDNKNLVYLPSAMRYRDININNLEDSDNMIDLDEDDPASPLYFSKGSVEFGQRRAKGRGRNTVLENPTYQRWVAQMQARRQANEPIFSVPDKYEPWQEELQTRKDAEICDVHPACKHKLDGEVKYLNGGYDWKTFKTILKPCPHCKYENERLRRLRIASKDFSKLGADAGIPKYALCDRYTQKEYHFKIMPEGEHSFPSAVDEDAISEIYECVSESLERIKERGQGTSMMLVGATGAGKTVVASAILRLYMEAGYAGYFTLVLRHLRNIQNTYGRGELTETERRYEGNLLAVPVLVFDDLGSESPSDWALQKIFSLIEERDSNGLITIITSNNSLSALRKHWKKLQDEEVQQQSGRIIRRIRQRYTVIDMPGGETENVED